MGVHAEGGVGGVRGDWGVELPAADCKLCSYYNDQPAAILP